jgi:hypothetical protein
VDISTVATVGRQLLTEVFALAVGGDCNGVQGNKNKTSAQVVCSLVAFSGCCCTLAQEVSEGKLNHHRTHAWLCKSRPTSCHKHIKQCAAVITVWSFSAPVVCSLVAFSGCCCTLAQEVSEGKLDHHCTKEAATGKAKVPPQHGTCWYMPATKQAAAVGLCSGFVFSLVAFSRCCCTLAQEVSEGKLDHHRTRAACNRPVIGQTGKHSQRAAARSTTDMEGGSSAAQGAQDVLSLVAFSRCCCTLAQEVSEGKLNHQHTIHSEQHARLIHGRQT